MDNIDQLVEQVLNVDSSKSTFDIRKDLEHTKSVELTLNRIFDGEVNMQKKSCQILFINLVSFFEE